MLEAVLCPPSKDDSFGPYAGPCRGGFDFTLLFEESTLIVPQCIFLLALPFRAAWLIKRSDRVRAFTLLQWLKVTATVSLACLQLALLVLWSTTGDNQIRRTRASVPTAALSFVVSLGVCLLSFLEHMRSVRPSLIIDIWLFLSILFDVVRARTLWLLQESRPILILQTCTIAVRCCMLILESTGKRSILLAPYKDYPLESLSGTFCRSIFFWLNSLIAVGYFRILTLNDLASLDEELDAAKLHAKFQVAWDKADQIKRGALFSTFLSMHQWQLCLAIIPRLVLMGFTFAQPFLINHAITLAISPVTKTYNNIGFGLIGAYILVYFGIGISNGRYEHRMYRLAIMMRGCLIPCIYRKTLSLNSSDATPFAALTLINTDIEIIRNGLVQLHEVWASFIEIGLAIYLLERQLGWAAAVPIIVMVATGFFSAFTAPRQAEWNAASQKRVSRTAAIIDNIKWIKLSGLTEFAFSAVKDLRVEELTVSKRCRKLLSWTVTLSQITSIFNPVLTFTAFAAIALRTDGTLTISRTFTSLSIFTLLNKPLGIIVTVLPTVAASMASFNRIQEYLNIAPKEDKRIHKRKASSLQEELSFISETGLTEMFQKSTPETDVIASLQGKLRWMDSQRPALDIDNWKIQRRSLTLLLGPVGCGKSTLLKCLLGEMPSFEGSIYISDGGIAFCDQTPWLPNATVREVIVGNSAFDSEWYDMVLRACALEEDMRLWARGDSSPVGSRGISLSGGQKQRIALARAVYSRKEFIILDDVFSGLDSKTEDEVFYNLFGQEGLLKRVHATVLMASSDARRAPYVDDIVILDEEGVITKQESVNATDITADIITEISSQSSMSQSRIFSDSTDGHDSIAKEPEEENVIADAEARENRRTGDSSVYKYYIRSAGLLSPVVFITTMAILAFCDSFPTLWLKWWAQANTANPNSDLGKWIGVYVALAIGCLISLLIGCWQLFVEIISKSGRHFHSLLVKTVSCAPISFFSSVDSGITINRFSQDLQLIDMKLPLAAFGVAIGIAYSTAQVIMMTIASKYMAIVFPFIILVFWAIQHVYLRTSRQMRFLDIEYKAPLYSQMLETLSGLATIRAFQWEDDSEKKNLKLLCESQRPYYLLYSLQRWLIFSIDTVIAFMAVILIVITVTQREYIGPGYMGVALVNIMAFAGTMKAMITSWVSLEITIGAVARVKNFVAGTQTEDHTAEVQSEPPADWPSQGTIEIRGLVASYPNSGPALKGISLSIQGGEKVGVCGRTGSGKSTLLQCLLRMADIEYGFISVDGIDISTIAHEDVRRRLVAVPQESYIFEGSILENADPSLSIAEGVVINALKQVRLWDTVQQMGGLNAVIDAHCFSEGEKKLLSFARAMLRKSKILILDEVTSSLDEQTSKTIDEVVRTNFSDWTVIAVAHKLSSILHFDKVAVLDEGVLVEFDSPQTLLESPTSLFKSLYETSEPGSVGNGNIARRPPRHV